MRLTEIKTIQEFLEESENWDGVALFNNAEKLKNHHKQNMPSKRDHYYNDIFNLIEQLRTLVKRLGGNIYEKPNSETWEQYQINRQILRRFWPDFECPTWKEEY